MKLVPLSALLLLLAGRTKASNDWEAGWYAFMEDSSVSVTEKMWVFAGSGLHVMEPDGSATVIHREHREICQAGDAIRGPPMRVETCQFVEAVSDGHKYVWITNGSPDGRYYLDVFSMNNAQLVASVPTCTVPRHLDYAPHREELWLHCWMYPTLADPQDDGQVAIYSTNSLGVKHDKVELYGTDIHTHGTVIIDPSLPNSAFSVSNHVPTLFKIDASTRKIVDTLEMPNTIGLSEYAFSSGNRHIFLRTYVCCPCSEDALSCDDSARGLANVTVINGPGASATPQLGYCGLFCRGSSADTQGVVEYDAVNHEVLGQHYPPEGTTGLQPFTTPQGDLVFLAVGNGKSVIVLRAGETGEMSANVGTITLLFDGTSDLTVVPQGNKRTAIFTSTLSNDVAMVDLDEFQYATGSQPVSITAKSLSLHDNEEISAMHDVRGVNVRKVRWATGTKYVWIDSTKSDKLHIVELSPDGDLSKAKVIRTVDNLDSKDFVFVRNYYEEKIKSLIVEASLSEAASIPSSETTNQGTAAAVPSSETASLSANREDLKAEAASLSATNHEVLQDVQNDIDRNSSTAIAALAISIAAIILALLGFVIAGRNSSAVGKTGKEPSVTCTNQEPQTFYS